MHTTPPPKPTVHPFRGPLPCPRRVTGSRRPPTVATTTPTQYHVAHPTPRLLLCFTHTPPTHPPATYTYMHRAPSPTTHTMWALLGKTTAPSQGHGKRRLPRLLVFLGMVLLLGQMGAQTEVRVGQGIGVGGWGACTGNGVGTEREGERRVGMLWGVPVCPCAHTLALAPSLP